jgi:hypothetical protein
LEEGGQYFQRWRDLWPVRFNERKLIVIFALIVSLQLIHVSKVHPFQSHLISSDERSPDSTPVVVLMSDEIRSSFHPPLVNLKMCKLEILRRKSFPLQRAAHCSLCPIPKASKTWHIDTPFDFRISLDLPVLVAIPRGMSQRLSALPNQSKLPIRA